MNFNPEHIHNAGPCPYCRVEIRLYGAQFANTDDGEWHTCQMPAGYKGPMYVNGDFFHTSFEIVPKEKL